MTVGSDFPGVGARTFRPRPALLVLLIVGALGVLGWAILAAAPLDRVVAIGTALALSMVALIGWRRRLTVGPRGLLVAGISGNRIVPWSDVTGLHAATSKRLGLTSVTIEIDLVDE